MINEKRDCDCNYNIAKRARGHLLHRHSKTAKSKRDNVLGNKLNFKGLNVFVVTGAHYEEAAIPEQDQPYDLIGQ